jgi:hypothetical protein
MHGNMVFQNKNCLKLGHIRWNTDWIMMIDLLSDIQPSYQAGFRIRVTFSMKFSVIQHCDLQWMFSQIKMVIKVGILWNTDWIPGVELTTNIQPSNMLVLEWEIFVHMKFIIFQH